tara:strand:+ start:28108 stop:29304 length:1197 start_codon:yes stop_codon:yes gene_type:complete
MRNLLFVVVFLVSLTSVSQTKYQKDFHYLWSSIENYYAYFDQKQTDWNIVKEIYQKKVDTISKDPQFIKLVEDVIYELYDAHISINRNLNSSFRLIPSSTDAWIKIKKGKYYISDIRPNYKIENSGISIGTELISINGRKINELVKSLLPKSIKNPKDDVKEFIANLLFAGRHNEERNFIVNNNGKESLFRLTKPTAIENNVDLFSSKIIEGNIGYIKFNNSLGNNSVITAFPEKVDEFKNTKAILLDLRDTPGGGNAEVAKSIMGKFVTKTIPYQKHERVSLEKEFGIKRSWIELLSPLKNPYEKPVIILVGRWTGSIGEAIAQGFSEIESAKVVGTPMAQLLGSINCSSLPGTKINLCFPTEKLYHVNGTPRENFIPEYKTNTSKEAYFKALELLK